MTFFWILSILFILLAAGFLFYPLVSARRYAEITLEVAEQDRIAQNVVIFKERLKELELEKAEGKLSESEFDQLKDELEGTLLIDAQGVASGESKSAAKRDPFTKTSIIFAGILTVGVAAATYGLYFEWGEYEQTAKRQNATFNPEDIARAREAAERGDMDALLTQLEEKLAENPDNLEGWSLLARSALNMERFSLAEKAFLEVARILETQEQPQASVYGMIAQARYFGSKNQLTIDVQNMINKAFLMDAQEVNALGVLAIHSFENGQYEDAIKYWERIIDANPEHISRAAIDSAILRAKRLAGIEVLEQPSNVPVVSNLDQTPQATQTESLVNDPQVAQIEVTVTLDEALKEKAAPGDFVFIFARAPDGPPLPLAASRHTVSELPVTIVLNDAKAMAPMARLSNVQAANIVARVSKSGQPIATPGDLEGKQEGVATFGGSKVSIKIDTQL